MRKLYPTRRDQRSTGGRRERKRLGHQPRCRGSRRKGSPCFRTEGTSCTLCCRGSSSGSPAQGGVPCGVSGWKAKFREGIIIGILDTDILCHQPYLAAPVHHWYRASLLRLRVLQRSSGSVPPAHSWHRGEIKEPRWCKKRTGFILMWYNQWCRKSLQGSSSDLYPLLAA